VAHLKKQLIVVLRPHVNFQVLAVQDLFLVYFSGCTPGYRGSEDSLDLLLP